ncbi:hypothetical protein PHISCL_01319 [Aspergillus sclerotialis]|uniref:Uncharacterized protein n=1 Tax=Aspergillus sclerotialis TaxID=2070753 RepID=A0A3A2ZTF6_9EURO|nr:hypothetical protein PHISCL_01319 [Aspergillus sclerotialis]
MLHNQRKALMDMTPSEAYETFARFGQIPTVILHALDPFNQIPLFQEVLAQLRGHHRLRDIFIVVYKNAGADFQHITYGIYRPLHHWTCYDPGTFMLDFGGFQNLRSLALIVTPLEAAGVKILADQLVSTLMRSPNLTLLDIGFSSIQHQQLLLPTLWLSYESTGGRPLPLKDIHLHECDPYGSNQTMPSEAWACVSGLSRLCNLEGLQGIAVERSPLSGITPLSDRPVCLPRFTHSIRKFRTRSLDSDMLGLIEETGNDCTLPMDFLSELHFEQCKYMAGMAQHLVLDENKRSYWPRVFSVEVFNPALVNGHITPPHVMRDMIHEIYGWKGLKRLQLPLELDCFQERKLAFGLANALKDNLYVLSIRSSSFCTYESDKYETDALEIYTENTAKNTRSQHNDSRISLTKRMETPEDRLKFTKKLCAVSNLKFIGIFNIFFEIHITPWERVNVNRYDKVAWLHQLTLDKREYYEFYWAVIHRGEF